MGAINFNTLTKKLFSNFVFSNLPVIIALVMLASTPFFLLQNEQEIANQIAGYAYYLLIVAILWKIIQHFMNNHFEKKNKSEKKEEKYA
jgi:hypothetical protein